MTIKLTKTTKKAVHKELVPFVEFSARIKAVARGEASLPEWAGKQVYATEGARQYWTQQRILERAQVAGITKLLADNQKLLGVMQAKQPPSVHALALLVKRSDSNVSRSLGKLEKFGIVKLHLGEGKAKRPVLATDRLVIEIDVASGEVVINRRDSAPPDASLAPKPTSKTPKASASA